MVDFLAKAHISGENSVSEFTNYTFDELLGVLNVLLAFLAPVMDPKINFNYLVMDLFIVSH